MARPLVIPILGNTSDLEAAMARAGVVAEDASKKITGSFRSAGLAAAEEAKKLGASVDEQAAAAGRAAAAFTEMSAKITTAQRNAGKAAATAAGAVGASVDEQRAAYLKAIAVQSDYEAAMQKAADVAKATAAEQAAAAKAAADAAEKAAARTTAAAESAKSKLASLGKWSIAGGIGVGAVSVKGAVDLQRQMEQIHTQAGASQAEVAKMTQAVTHMAGSLGTGPQALADSLYHVESAGFRGAEALNIMSTAAKASKISGADLTDTTTALTAAVFSGIQGAQNFTQAMGLLNATVGAGDMKFQDLNEAFAGPMLATVKGYGLSLKDVGAALATFGDLNIRGADAATELRMAVQYMAKPAATAGPLLEKLGLNTHSFADAMAHGGLMPALQLLHDKLQAAGVQGNQMAQVIGDLFTKKGAAGITILENSLSKLDAKQKQVGAGTHKFGQDWNATTQTAAFKADQLKATVQALGDKFGAWLLPKLLQVAAGVQNVITWFDKHKSAAQALAATIGGVLGLAITVFVGEKVVAFVNGTKAMITGIGKVASGVGSAVSTIAGKLAAMVTTTEGTAATVEASDAQIAAANATAGGSFTAMGAEAATGAAEVESQVAAMATATETADGAIEAANATAGASFTAMLGPIAAVAAAAGGLGAILNTFGTPNSQAPTITGGNGQQYPNPRAAPFSSVTGWAGNPRSNPLGLPPGYGGGALGSFFGATHNTSSGLPSGYGGGGAVSAFNLSSTGYNGTQNAPAFAAALLSSVGAPVNAANLSAVVGWIQREGNNPSIDKNNPLDTTLSGFGGVSTNSVGVKSYPSVAAGLAATVKTLQQGNFAAILASLKAGHGLSGPGVSTELASWSGGGYSSAPPAKLTTAQLDALLNSATGKHGAAKAIKTLLYANPFGNASFTTGRTDQGVDFSAAPGTPIDAIGAGVVKAIINNWYKGQPLIEEQLTQGPNKGQYVYYAEQIRSGVRVGQQLRAGQQIGVVAPSGTGLELGFGAPGGRTLAQATTGYTEGQVTPAGRAFARFFASLHNGIYTTTSNGITTGGGQNFGITIAQAVQQFIQSLTKASNALIQTYQNVEQTGTLRTFTKALGVNTGHGVSRALHVKIEGLDPAQVQKALTAGTDPHQLDKVLIPILEKASAKSQATAQFNTLVAELLGAGKTGQAGALISARGGAFAALAQEMYAQQLTKDAESIQLQATQEKDRTTIAANAAAAQLQVFKDGQQKDVDILNSQATAIKDMTQTITDRFSAMAQAVENHTQQMADASNAVVQGLNDQTQIRVDILGERGLFGLNLIAQREQVQLDIMKAGFDQQIATGQANLDTVKATMDQIVSQKQLQVDQITTAQDQLIALAQQRADTAQLHADQKIAIATAHADSVTLAQDIAVQLAQTAVDLSANAPKAQQDAANAQLKKAQATATRAETDANKALSGAQIQANQIVNTAQHNLAEAQARATIAEGQAQQALARAQGQASLAIAQATQALQGTEDTAAQAEAALQGQIDITKATASTQFSGSGLVVNMYGIPMDNGAAIGSAMDWFARTQLGALS